MPCGPRGDQAGKLRAVARAWATGRGGGQASDDDALTAAVAAELARRGARRGATAATIEVAPDEVDAVGLFMALGTQWRWHAMVGQRLGLVYEAIAPAAAALGIALTPSLFADLRTMEGAALAASAK